MPSLAGLTPSTAVAGNSVEVLENGAFLTCCCSEFARLKSQCISKPFFGRKGCLVSAWRTRCRRRLGSLYQELLDLGKSEHRKDSENICICLSVAFLSFLPPTV
jgi:hypothetical protein